MDTGHYTMYSKHRGEVKKKKESLKYCQSADCSTDKQWFKFEDHNVTTTFQKDVLDSKA